MRDKLISCVALWFASAARQAAAFARTDLAQFSSWQTALLPVQLFPASKGELRVHRKKSSIIINCLGKMKPYISMGASNTSQ